MTLQCVWCIGDTGEMSKRSDQAAWLLLVLIVACIENSLSIKAHVLLALTNSPSNKVYCAPISIDTG